MGRQGFRALVSQNTPLAQYFKIPIMKGIVVKCHYCFDNNLHIHTTTGQHHNDVKVTSV